VGVGCQFVEAPGFPEGRVTAILFAARYAFVEGYRLVEGYMFVEGLGFCEIEEDGECKSLTKVTIK